MADDPKQTLIDLEKSLQEINDNAIQFGKSLNKSLESNIISSKKLIEKFKSGNNITKDLEKNIKQIDKTQNELNRNISKELLLLATATKSSKVKIKQNINNLNLQKKLNEDLLVELKELEAINEKKKEGNQYLNAASKALETNLGFNIKNTKEMFTMVGAMTFFVKAALQANTQSVALGKSLGYGVDRANALRYTFVDIERSSNNVNVNTKNLTEAFNELATSSGYVYEFSADQLETQIKLTKQVGLSAEEASKINDLGVVNNKTSESTYKSFVRGLAATRNQLKVGIDFKATLAEAAKVSGQLAANLGYNPERIAKAIVTAKAFGMTLEQVAKSGESLLNFETSIDNELKAELLTGKALNLERARAAALSGDQVTLAEELAKNVGTAAQFSKMNILQQKALAEAVGMTADELGNTLVKREQALKSGKSLAQITADEAAQAIERQTIQDKFNAGIEKLQSLIGNLLAGPLGTMLDVFNNILSSSINLYSALGLIALIKFSNITGAFKNIGGIGDKLKGLLGGGQKAVETASEKTKGGGISSFLKGINPMDMIKGAAAVLILSGALYVAAKAFQELNKVKWEDVGMGAIALIGFTAAVFGLGALIAGPGAIIFGAGIVGFLALGAAMLVLGEGLSSISGKNVDLLLTATALQSIATSLSNVSSALTSMDISKLDALDEFANNRSNQSIIKGITDFIFSPIQEVNNTPIITETKPINPGIDLTPMISAINEVRQAVDRLYSKDTSINLDGKKVGSGLTQGSYKVA